MRITWVNPAFGPYRIPVYRELDAVSGGGLHVICSARRTGEDRVEALRAAIGDRGIALRGERLGNVGGRSGYANQGVRVPYQPGLLRAILSTRPECLIGEGFFQWTPAALAASVHRRIPLVVAYERTGHTERRAGRMRLLYRRLVCRAVDTIVCNGTQSRDFCTHALGVPAERIFTGAMAADTAFMAGGDTAAEPEGLRGLPRPRFLFAGRLVAAKGVHELVAAWSRAAATHPDIGSLVLVGDGPERARVEQAVRARSLRSVHLVGAVDYREMPQYYAACDALVMPTLEDNWSLVVPEAMAAGKPVICSRYNGCWPELVHDGENGWVFDPLDIQGAAGVLLRAAESRDALAGMGQASRRIISPFTPARAAGAVYAACESAVRHRRGAPR